MLVDGKKIANELRDVLAQNVARFPRPPTLAIVVVGEDPVIESFVRIKKKFGASIGVHMIEVRFAATVSGELLKDDVTALCKKGDVDGVIIQLPLPSHIDTQAILNTVPRAKDVDVLSQDAIALFARGDAAIFPPVASAVQAILERHQVDVAGKEVLVLGYGRLVGKPVSILLRHNHAHVTVVDKPIADLATHVRESDIIISGVGTPELIMPDMLNDHVVLIDAGTSEQGGKIVGDAHPLCAERAQLLTPVPGGVGPIAIAMLFKNLLILGSGHHEAA